MDGLFGLLASGVWTGSIIYLCAYLRVLVARFGCGALVRTLIDTKTYM